MATKSVKDYAQDYTHPTLRYKLKEGLKKGGKGGKPGEWSARKSQLLIKTYENCGGDYKHKGLKTEAQKNLKQWSSSRKDLKAKGKTHK